MENKRSAIWVLTFFVMLALPVSIFYSTHESYNLYKEVITKNVNTTRALILLNQTTLGEFKTEKQKIFEELALTRQTVLGEFQTEKQKLFKELISTNQSVLGEFQTETQKLIKELVALQTIPADFQAEKRKLIEELTSTNQSVLTNFQVEKRKLIEELTSMNKSALGEFQVEKQKIFKELVALQTIPKEILFSHYLVTVRFPEIAKVTIVSGTAVAISAKQLVTCAHVVLSDPTKPTAIKREVRIHLFSPESGEELEPIIAEVTKANKESDLALLTISTDLPFYLKENNLKLNKVNIGDSIYSVGATIGTTPYNIRFGNLTNYTNKFDTRFWHGTIPINEGDSGGGVFDHKTGSLIGITSHRILGGNLFISIKNMNKFLTS